MEGLKKYVEGVKGLIFDYGGTLDTGGDHWSWVIWEAWQEAGIKVSLATFREAYVQGERELARALHILPQHDFQDMLNIKIKIELEWLAGQGEFPPEEIEVKAQKVAEYCNKYATEQIEEVKPLLAKLSEKYQMVVVSNFYGNLTTVLKKFGIFDCFRKVIESEQVGFRKPDPEIFKLGVKALGCQPEECLAVGDSLSKDILPAQEAGCKAIWLKGKTWDGEEEQTAYPYTVSNLGELLRILG